MIKTIKVDGMHCDACKKLVMMELEENNLDQCVDSINIAGDTIGDIILHGDSRNDDVEKIKSVINGMEGYVVK